MTIRYLKLDLSRFIAGQILSSGKYQQSKDISEKPPGLRCCAEDPSGLTRAGMIRVNGLTLSCRPTTASNLWTHSVALKDTFNGSASNKPFFTSVASITVLVRDIDNRPPWFQPCLRAALGAAKLCVSTGYRGRVNLTEKEVRHSSITVGSRSLWYMEIILLTVIFCSAAQDGPLVLEPGPVFAKDGDKNRSEQISYRILRGLNRTTHVH